MECIGIKSLLYKDLVENSVPWPIRVIVVDSDAPCMSKFTAQCKSVGGHLRFIWLVYLRGLWFRVVGAASFGGPVIYGSLEQSYSCRR